MNVHLSNKNEDFYVNVKWNKIIRDGAEILINHPIQLPDICWGQIHLLQE